ncbi:hypothetical protein CCH79_00020077 [Gambusia affinis]|uniref:Uncharacterized protein n=1 Tax=Gambusia affinis TaxID=33528 RepID=A0A315VDB8_GAMAF|nr:hypothetical protein CCH79_00020077 [Gambusia affinis]
MEMFSKLSGMLLNALETLNCRNRDGGQGQEDMETTCPHLRLSSPVFAEELSCSFLLGMSGM